MLFSFYLRIVGNTRALEYWDGNASPVEGQGGSSWPVSVGTDLQDQQTQRFSSHTHLDSPQNPPETDSHASESVVVSQVRIRK